MSLFESETRKKQREWRDGFEDYIAGLKEKKSARW